MIGASSAPDPFVLTGAAAYFGNDNTDGKTASSPLSMVRARTFVAIVAGQSLSANYGETQYTPTNTGKVLNLNVFDGGMYPSMDPMLGCSGDGGHGTWMNRMADLLINSSFCNNVIFVTVGIGATSIVEWIPGGQYNQLLIVANRRLAAWGLTADAVLWQQGEANAIDGMSQVAWQDNLVSIVTQQRALGYMAKWFIAKSTTVGNVSNSTIRAAQAGVVNGGTIFQGPDVDTLTGPTNRIIDGTHLTGVGCDNEAALWVPALVAAFGSVGSLGP